MSSALGTIIRGDTRPKVPPFVKLDPGAEQQLAIKNNLAALPGAENLVSQANAFNQQQVDEMLRAAISNYDEMKSAASNTINSMIHGEIPQDVQNMIQMNDAARALSGGYAGSGFHGNLVARDFGLTSLNLRNAGIDTAARWMQNMNELYAPGRLNLASMFLSPQQQFAMDASERDNAWNVQWLKNQIRARPNQYQEAAAQIFDSIEQVGRSILTSYAGGAMGGAGGMGGGGGSPSPTSAGGIAGANYQWGGPNAIQTGTY